LRSLGINFWICRQASFSAATWRSFPRHFHEINCRFQVLTASVWLVRGLADVFGFDLIARTNGMTLKSVTGAGVALSMLLLVRLGSAKPIALFWLSAGALAASTLVIGPAASIWLGVALISVLFSVGAIYPLVMSPARTVLPTHRLGIALGLLNTLVFLGIGLANACFGVIASEGHRAHLTAQQIYAALFAVTALMLAIGAMAYVFSPRTDRPRPGAQRE
jgi:MFS family permease